MQLQISSLTRDDFCWARFQSLIDVGQEFVRKTQSGIEFGVKFKWSGFDMHALSRRHFNLIKYVWRSSNLYLTTSCIWSALCKNGLSISLYNQKDSFQNLTDKCPGFQNEYSHVKTSIPFVYGALDNYVMIIKKWISSWRS